MEEEDFIEGEKLGNEEESDDDNRHERLLLAVSNSEKNKARKRERNEANNVLSEFTLSRKSEDEIQVGDLLGTLGKTTDLAKLRKAVTKKRTKGTTLVTPLSKHVAEKIERAAGYEKVCVDVGKWDTIVKQNRNARQMQFPLTQPQIYTESMQEFVNSYKFSTPLELEMAALLGENRKVDKSKNDKTKEDKNKEWTKVAMDEAIELRNEMRKIRARQTYQESKERKRNKIKSKRYRRILKKERLKKEAAELEELQQKNPKLMLEKLEEFDKKRINERMNLRHRNTGKWARYNLLKSKFKLDSGRAIQEQIELSRALTAKQLVVSDSDSEEEMPIAEENKKAEERSTDPSNPWFTISKTKSTVIEKEIKKDELQASQKPIIRGYRRYWEGVSAKRKAEESLEIPDEPLIDESDQRIKKLSDIKNVVIDSTPKIANVNITKSNAADMRSANFTPLVTVEQLIKEADEEQVDPSKFITVEPKTVSFQSADINMEENELDDVKVVDQRAVVAEAFADDDLVEEFKADKRAVVEAEKPQDICLALPGWGEWGGRDLEISHKKRIKFTIPAEVHPRKDGPLKHVILNEEGDAPLRAHMLDKVPFPYRTKEQFEKSLKNPIGKHWNSEIAFTRQIAPKIITKMGVAIKPMDEQSIDKTKKAVHTSMMRIQKGKLKYVNRQ